MLWKSLLQNVQPQQHCCVRICFHGPRTLYATGAGEAVNVAMAVFHSNGGGVSRPAKHTLGDAFISWGLNAQGLLFTTILEQRQVVVFVADDLGFLGPGIPDLVTDLCPPRDTA